MNESLDASKNLIGPASESAQPVPYGQPRAPFASNLVLTYDMECQVDARAEQWKQVLTQSSGWEETGSEEDWLLNGLPTVGRNGLQELNRKHFVKRAYYEAMSENRWEHRQWANGPDSIFGRSNMNAPLCRRISRALAAKAINGFFGTKPYFVCYPVGPSDLESSESIQKVAEQRLESSNGTASLRDAVNIAFDLGECVVKVAHRNRSSLYRKNDVVLGDGSGGVVLGQDGEYITEKDVWVMAEVPDAMGIPAPMKTLKRDGVTPWPRGAQWLRGSFARTVTHYKGPEITNIYYRNFLANWDAANLQEAECCIHMYEVGPEELAAMFTDAKGIQILQSIEVLRQISGVNPVSISSDVLEAGMPASTKVKVEEYWMRCDADGDGVTEDICYVRINAGGGWTPLFYDYVQNVTDTKERPFYEIVPVRRKGRWTGIGAIEMFEKHQEAVDLMLNRWAFSTSSSGRILAYDPAAFELANGEEIDLSLNDGKAYKLKPGKKLSDAVQDIYLQDTVGDKWLAIFQTFLQLAMNESGVQHANDGAMAGMETTKLATGIRNVERSGNENFSVFMSCLEDGVQKVIRAFVQTLYSRIDANEVVRILEGKVPQVWTVEPRDVQGLEFDVTVMLSRYRSEQMLESVRAVLPDCLGYYTALRDNPIAQMRLMPLFHQLLKGAQVENPEEIIIPMSEFTPEEIAASAEFAMTLPPEIQQMLTPMISIAASMAPQPQPQQKAA